MAKAKKTEPREAAPKKKAPPKKLGPAKPAGAAASMPMVDTSLAAQLAVKALLNRAKLAQHEQPVQAEKPESDSASFKQLKESINKPHTQVIGEALHKITPASQRPGGLPNVTQRPSGHAQTQANFNRVGVPRRTPG